MEESPERILAVHYGVGSLGEVKSGEFRHGLETFDIDEAKEFLNTENSRDEEPNLLGVYRRFLDLSYIPSDSRTLDKPFLESYPLSSFGFEINPNLVQIGYDENIFKRKGRRVPAIIKFDLGEDAKRIIVYPYEKINALSQDIKDNLSLAEVYERKEDNDENLTHEDIISFFDVLSRIKSSAGLTRWEQNRFNSYRLLVQIIKQ